MKMCSRFFNLIFRKWTAILRHLQWIKMCRHTICLCNVFKLLIQLIHSQCVCMWFMCEHCFQRNITTVGKAYYCTHFVHWTRSPVRLCLVCDKKKSNFLLPVWTTTVICPQKRINWRQKAICVWLHMYNPNSTFWHTLTIYINTELPLSYQRDLFGCWCCWEKMTRHY